jgi:hypothetical protein
LGSAIYPDENVLVRVWFEDVKIFFQTSRINKKIYVFYVDFKKEN